LIPRVALVRCRERDAFMGRELSKIERELVVNVAAGRVSVAEECLAKGASPNIIGWEDNPILVMAVQAQKPEMVRLLLAHKADVWAVGAINTPIEAAVSGSSLEITTLLLDAAPPLTDETTLRAYGFFRKPRTAEEKRQCILIQALRDGQCAQVELLEKKGFAKLDPAKTGPRALFEAARRGDWETCAFLVQRGVPTRNALWLIPAAVPALRTHGLQDPYELARGRITPNQLIPLGIEGALRECRKAFEQLTADRAIEVRKAEPVELTSLMLLGVDRSVLSFFSEFTAKSHGRFPVYPFRDLILENVELSPQCFKTGYFIFGGDICGDWFAFGPKAIGDRPTPPVFRFDHEVWPYNDPTPSSIQECAKQIAADIVEFASNFLEDGKGRR
jgi:hypothetical protein